ncbi:MAG: phosphoribosylformylglycinamidine synthase subunit PurQ [Methanomethylophilus sp.]|nr:phosphoribosylformylglycinamidine synthase subunit PurQ [Methanomethylophilus sp.]MDD4669392.1 phosphoribosylformylglycinamidine synthase subunit PurQ [Methanomethylophilus sp.]
MKAQDVKVCVLRIEGTNCEDEMVEAFRTVGARPEKVHLKQLLGQCSDGLKRSLEEYDILALPGGFSAGDYVRAGALFAARIKAAVGHDLKMFVEAGKPVLGVCNGFQVLVELGLLPAFDGTMAEQPEAALYTNDSGRFECRPSVLRNDNRGNCVFTTGIKPGALMQIPSAHGEGRLLSSDPRFLDRLETGDQVVFRYVQPDGSPAVYPWNPNGSPSDIAGICNPVGNVMGMMPHPERAVTAYTAADWTRGHRSEDGDGKQIFTAVMKYLSKR